MYPYMAYKVRDYEQEENGIPTKPQGLFTIEQEENAIPTKPQGLFTRANGRIDQS